MLSTKTIDGLHLSSYSSTSPGHCSLKRLCYQCSPRSLTGAKFMCSRKSMRAGANMGAPCCNDGRWAGIVRFNETCSRIRFAALNLRSLLVNHISQACVKPVEYTPPHGFARLPRFGVSPRAANGTANGGVSSFAPGHWAPSSCEGLCIPRNWLRQCPSPLDVRRCGACREPWSEAADRAVRWHDAGEGGAVFGLPSSGLAPENLIAPVFRPLKPRWQVDSWLGRSSLKGILHTT